MPVMSGYIDLDRHTAQSQASAVSSTRAAIRNGSKIKKKKTTEKVNKNLRYSMTKGHTPTETARA